MTADIRMDADQRQRQQQLIGKANGKRKEFPAENAREEREGRLRKQG